MIDLLASSEGGETQFSVLAVPIGELIVGTIAFLIVFGVLAKVLLPKISKALDEREKAIEDGLRQAETAREESAKAAEEHESILAEAREEAASIRAAAQAERADIIERARSEAQDAADQVVKSSQEQIHAEANRAKRELRSSVGELATDVAGRIIGESLIDEAKARSVIDNVIAELESAAETAGKA